MGDFRRNVDPDVRRKTNKSLLELKELQAEYNASRQEADKLDKRLQAESDNLASTALAVEEARNQLSEAQEEIDVDYLPEGAQPRARIQRRDELALRVEQLETALGVQRGYAAKANEIFMEAERRLFEADKNLNRFAETLEDVVLAKETIAALDEEKKRRLAKIEGRAKENKEKAARLAQKAKEAQAKELQMLEEQRKATAKVLNVAARKKVAAVEQEARAAAATVKATEEDRLNERFKAVYQLKTSTNLVNAELAGLAAKHNNKIATAKKRLEDEKDTLLSKGLNPYVEFRKEELATEARNREQRMKDAVEQNKRDLAERLQREAAFIAKQEHQEKLAKQYEQEHRASQGRTVVEERNHNYILSQTKGEMEVLDPLGKAARIYPSQIVEKRTELTGVKRITAQIRETMGITKDSAEDDEGGSLGEPSPAKSLSTTLLRTQSAPGAAKTAASIAAQLAAMGGGDAESSAGGTLVLGPGMSAQEVSLLERLATQPGAMPGADKTAIELNLNGNDVEKKELLKLTVEGEGNLGTSNQLYNISSPKYKIPAMSKFERDALDRAKDRQRERVEEGVEQVAGGRTFHGPSFVSKPAELAFIDFDVGKVYKKRFILTNVSYTFNSFKYIDFDDSVFDFFQVTFDKPGRMSAGMSCHIDIEFTPKVNTDIFTAMRFHTQTGPVEIPVKCLIKRCAPRILTPEIDFGNVVMGQKLYLPIKIHNTQAIPTRFTIVPLQPESEASSAEGGATEGATGSRAVSAAGKSRSPAGPEEEEAAAVALEGDHIGAEPALNQAELTARVRRKMTEVLRAKQKESPQPLSCKVLEGQVDGYGSTTIEVQCAPLSLGVLEQRFMVVFEDVREVMESVDDLGQLVKREQFVTARTHGDEVPIYVAEEVMDMQCTLFDRVYRKKIVLKNRAKAAYRVIVKVAAMFAPYVEVNPTMFFVQARSSQSMNVKFAPTAAMLAGVAHFTLPYEEFQAAALSSLPIEVQVVNQEIPAYFILTSNVCASRVELSTSVMDFGKVYVGQKSTRKITIRNTSMLPQKTAFVRLRKEFLVQPNDGFALLLPNETQEFEISFGPQSAINYEVNVTLLTSFNDSYMIKVLAEGVDPPLVLSAPVVQMRTTYPGERVIENIMVRNASRHTQCFQVMMPDKLYSWVTVSPAVMELPPGESGRLEVEFCPPTDAKMLDPLEWHQSLTQRADGPPTPFDEWLPDSGWVFGKGLYGQVQWVKEGARAAGDEDAPAPTETEAPSAAGMLDGEEGEEEDGGEAATSESNQLSKDVAAEEWGIVSRWNLPVLLRPRKRTGVALDATTAAGTAALGATAMDSTMGASLGSPAKTGALGKSGAAKVVPSPLFLTIECAVTLPMLDSDAKVVDFGQVSVGTRLLRSFKLFNRSQEAIKLHSIGLNAVGPFTLIRPIKEIGPGESRNVLVECLPARPGLNIEVLEISAEDPERGGHRVTLTFKVQGLMPAVELEGLSPPPPNWSPRTGVVDFGHALARDFVVKRFTVRNRSTFAINAVVVRVPSFKLNPNQQAEMVERTSTGLPVFSIRPMNVTIAQGGAEEIEVTFRPDRGRFHPFREDLDIMIGETDEILRVGIIGRSWDRQLIVVPDDPRDEPFANKLYKGTASVEDALMVSTSAAVRTTAAAARASLQLKFPDAPMILLQYPDPFAANASPASYVEVGSGAAADAKGKGAKGAPAAPAAGAGARQQVKRLVLGSTKVVDNRPGVGPGTFEIVLSPEALASGLFALSVDKGALAMGAADVPVDITCTVPKPRSLGGIFVGSWKVYKAEVVLKGGWRAEGAPEENRVPLTLKAYVCL